MTFMDQNNPFSFIFGTKPGAGVPTYEQLQMRRKIAESLLGQRSRYPKTFGEGLSAIGEAIGERGMMSRLEDMEQAKAAQDKATLDAIDSPTPAAPMARPMSYAPTAPIPPAAPVPGMAGTPTPVEDGGYNALDQGANLRDGPWAARSAAIAGIESGGAKNPYALMGARTRTGDRAHGKYQVMGNNIPGWTAAALGQPMTPQAFLANPEAQEAVFKHRFGGYVDKYGEEGAAKAWFAGERGMNNPSATDVHGRLTVRDYGQDYLKRLGPRSDVVDPALNQSVALNPTEPPLPSGPPTAFSGQPASDAPPIGMPDARDAITSALAPKPPPVVAPAALPAPLGPQIAQAPPQPQIRVPEREPTPPPAPQATEKMRRIEKALSTIGDPLQRDVLTKRYQQEWLDQKATYDQRLEEYKHKRNLWEAAPEKEAARKKAEQDYRKGELDIKKAQVPVLQEKVRSKMIWDEASGSFIRAPINGGAPQKGPPETSDLNETQSDNLKYYNWTREAEDTFEGKDKILADGYAQRAIGQIPFVGNALQEKKYRNASGAAERWVQGFMRDISGAAIGTAEYEKHMRTFFPMPGDSAQDIADKKRARANVTTGMYTGTGPGREAADYYDKERADARAASQAEAEQKMQGVPREAGKISNNGKGVRMRWTGSKWEEP